MADSLDDLSGAADPGERDQSGTTAVRPRPTGWGRLLQGNRVIWVIAGIAVVAMGAGLALGAFVVSPGQAAADAKPPQGGLITVPIEKKTLANDVTIRADASFADPIEVKVETGEIGGPAVVTGHVPEVGAQLNAGDIALEVTGRPVIVLPGELPVYRTLRAGVSGPDVVQLKAALRSLGIEPGGGERDVYDAQVAQGVAQLYNRIGYPAPAGAEGAADALRQARDAHASAQASLGEAQRALATAQAGPPASERLRLQNVVSAAQADRAEADEGASRSTIVRLDAAIAEAQAALAEATRAVNTDAERAAVTAASGQVTATREAIGVAEQDTLTTLPAAEVLYLTSLPRRVDEVTATRGMTIQAAVMRVSGAALRLSGSASEGDAALLQPGAAATFALPDGSDHAATIATVVPAKKSDKDDEKAPAGGRFTVTFEPAELSDDQIQALQGSNVRVKIPVSSTEGDVLAVPLAAVTAGPGGEARVEVRRESDERTELIEVTTGLAAGGFVEIAAIDGELAAGDLVVVGR